MSRWLIVLATLLMLTVNALANALPIGGNTTGDISDQFNILFTPAGYVFSIWGLIYAAVIAFTVLQALPAHHDRPVIKAIRPWFALNALANASWIFAWHHELFEVSLALMWVILGSLFVIGQEIRRHPEVAEGFGLIRATFSLYTGWISVAVIANFTVVLSLAGLAEQLADPAWTLGILTVATGLCSYVALRYADPIYAGVFVWALAGIAVKNASYPVLNLGAWSFAAVCALVAGAATVLAVRRARRA